MELSIKKDGKVLGILGGMGPYATVYAFKMVLDRFDAKKDWDYPRIIIDNNPKLPSRVRAILFGEHKEEISSSMRKGIMSLVQCGANIIFIPCNTAHYFIDKLPAFFNNSVKILDMIGLVLGRCKTKEYKNIGVLASEGIVDADVYGKYFAAYKGSDVTYLLGEYLKNTREIIEDVKQNKISAKTKEMFIEQINLFDNVDCVVIGCTELSLLWGSLSDNEKLMFKHPVLDALEISIDKIFLYLK